MNSATTGTNETLGAHPLRDGEVRIRIEPVTGSDDRWLLDVAAPDRRGLLATTASVAAGHGLSIVRADITCDVLGTALQRLELIDTRADERLSGEPEWAWFGTVLRSALLGETLPPPLEPAYEPLGRATVTVEAPVENPNATDDQWRVRVRAPDGAGLLATVATWLTSRGADIDRATISVEGDAAVDEFLVRGPAELPDAAADLARLLSAE